jgi:hypothetical protein
MRTPKNNRQMTRLLAGALAPGETVRGFCECVGEPPDRCWAVVTDRHFVWVRQAEDVSADLLRHEDLVGYRLRDGHLRLGWRRPTDEVPHVVTLRSPQRCDDVFVTFAVLTAAWSAMVGRRFPRDAFRQADGIPEFA